MKRRDMLRGAGLAAIAGSVAACTREPRTTPGGERFDWKLVTSWPTNFPGLGTGAARLAKMITAASGGRLTVRVHGAGELVPAFEVFDAVSRGTAEMGHSAAYYWQSRIPAAPLFCAVPFGLDAAEAGAWLHEGGGLALWREAYAPHGLRPFAAGNTGWQMAGWFRKPLESLASLQGLKIRLPGLGGEVMARLGAVPVNLPGDEIFAALGDGRLDAAEWMGPYNDLAFGLHRAARFGYYPGWQEPGPTLEAIVGIAAWERLPPDLQAIVETCCRALNDAMAAEYLARNARALDALVREHGADLRQLPADVLAALRRAADDVLDDLAARDALARRALDSMRAFRTAVRPWRAISDEAWHAASG
jgi:TRAP-type mannitol/chloroaromatic compound transport system substrate-binding protein